MERIQEISASLLECVQTDDVDGAKRLLFGFDKRERELIVAKRENSNAPLFVAATRGNKDMVEFLAKECHSDLEELGRYIFVDEECEYGRATPLWNAAASKKIEVVKLLINLGANMNTAASYTGNTPVLQACLSGNAEVVKCLVMHGADVKIPNNDGETCLMIAVRQIKELCQILIDNGAEVNAKDLSGNTALHIAIFYSDNNKERENVVQLLIDHGSNPNLRNKHGEDAFRMASLSFGRNDLILEKLILNFKPSVIRRIESYELLGAKAVNCDRRPIQIGRILPFWKKAMEMRIKNSCFDVKTLPPNPVYTFVQEVHSVEELETLCQNRDFVRVYALIIFERILGPNHPRMQSALLFHGEMYKRDKEFRRCIHIFKYAFQLQNACVKKRKSRCLRSDSFCHSYTSLLYDLCLIFCEAFRECQQHNNGENFGVEFEVVFEVLRMVTSVIDYATGSVHSLVFQTLGYQPMVMQSILHLMKLVIELDKNEDQLLRFNKIVYRLVRCQPKTQMGQTLLHLSIKECTSVVRGTFVSQFPSIAVVKLLLECGANVNAVDDEHNTALHSCSQAIRNLEMAQHHDLIKQIAVLLLKNEAHLDIINISGDRAAKGLTSSLVEINIHDFDSLKCLVARAIVKYKIPYVGNILASLEPFVQMQMHGICTSNHLPA